MSYGPDIKIVLPVMNIQTCQNIITQKVLCFSHSKVSKLDSINSQTVSINSQMALNVLKLNSILKVFEEPRIKNRVSSIELRETVNLHLNGTVCRASDISCGHGAANFK